VFHRVSDQRDNRFFLGQHRLDHRQRSFERHTQIIARRVFQRNHLDRRGVRFRDRLCPRHDLHIRHEVVSHIICAQGCRERQHTHHVVAYTPTRHCPKQRAVRSLIVAPEGVPVLFTRPSAPLLRKSSLIPHPSSPQTTASTPAPRPSDQIRSEVCRPAPSR